MASRSVRLRVISAAVAVQATVSVIEASSGPASSGMPSVAGPNVAIKTAKVTRATVVATASIKAKVTVMSSSQNTVRSTATPAR